MKVALLWPDYWPYIRRGTERMVHDISQYLLSRGDQVDIIASKPGPGAVETSGNLTIRRLPQVSHPVWQRYRQVPRFDVHGLMAIPWLLRGHYDMIHAFMYVYGPGLLLTRWLQATPTVYHLVMIPPTWGRRLDRELFAVTLAASGANRVFSSFGAQHVRDHLGIDTHVVPPTVDLDMFQPREGKDLAHPRILFTADLVQLPKGPHLMVLAFNEIHRRCPYAQLQLAGPVGAYPPAVKSLLGLLDPDARGAVHVLGPGALRDLPSLYAEAAVTVLPSLDEPFGMVLTESLASGTVVVGTNSGAIPEIISDERIGVLFERTVDDLASAHRLAEAVLAALSLAQRPGSEATCRAHALQWGWDAVGPRFDALERAATGAQAHRPRVPKNTTDRDHVRHAG